MDPVLAMRARVVQVRGCLPALLLLAVAGAIAAALLVAGFAVAAGLAAVGLLAALVRAVVRAVRSPRPPRPPPAAGRIVEVEARPAPRQLPGEGGDRTS